MNKGRVEEGHLPEPMEGETKTRPNHPAPPEGLRSALDSVGKASERHRWGTCSKEITRGHKAKIKEAKFNQPPKS